MLPLAAFVTMTTHVVGASPFPIQVTSDTIRGADACVDCMIFERGASIGALDDPMSLEGFVSLVRSSERYFASSKLNHPTDILLYNLGGEYIDDIGNAGEGPGEVESVWDVSHARGDSVLVAELGNRIHLFGPTGEFGRTVTLHHTGETVIQLSDGRFVVGGFVPTRRGVGAPLHLSDQDGRFLESFGSSDSRVLPGETRALSRVLVSTQDGGFWAAQPDQYVLEKWSGEGTMTVRLERQVDWFPPRARGSVSTDPTYPPTPTLESLFVEDGFLWVILWVPDEDWSTGSGVLSPDGLRRRWDSIVEIIDVRAREVLVHARTDEALLSFSGQREAYSLREGPLGLQVIDTWSLLPTKDARNPSDSSPLRGGRHQ